MRGKVRGTNFSGGSFTEPFNHPIFGIRVLIVVVVADHPPERAARRDLETQMSGPEGTIVTQSQEVTGKKTKC